MHALMSHWVLVGTEFVEVAVDAKITNDQPSSTSIQRAASCLRGNAYFGPGKYVGCTDTLGRYHRDATVASCVDVREIEEQY